MNLTSIIITIFFYTTILNSFINFFCIIFYNTTVFETLFSINMCFFWYWCMSEYNLIIYDAILNTTIFSLFSAAVIITIDSKLFLFDILSNIYIYPSLYPKNVRNLFPIVSGFWFPNIKRTILKNSFGSSDPYLSFSICLQIILLLSPSPLASCSFIVCLLRSFSKYIFVPSSILFLCIHIACSSFTILIISYLNPKRQSEWHLKILSSPFHCSLLPWSSFFRPFCSTYCYFLFRSMFNSCVKKKQYNLFYFIYILWNI